MSSVLYDRVLETSTTTGTGNITLAGAVTGFMAFSDIVSVSATFTYCIEAVDGSNIPSGQWEVGTGTYVSSGVFSRAAYVGSSGWATLVNFSAGTKRVYMSAISRYFEMLTGFDASMLFYVRTDGDDANDGLSNTSGGAFLTIQRAVDECMQPLRYGAAIISVGAGTYTENITLSHQGIISYSGNERLITITGAASHTSIINSTSNAPAITISDDCPVGLELQGVKITSSGGSSASGVLVGRRSKLFNYDVNYGACTKAQVELKAHSMYIVEQYSAISGGGQYHIYAEDGAYIKYGNPTAVTQTITGTPAFSVAYLYAIGCVVAEITGTTYSGSATGKRYDVRGCSFVNSGVTLPGGTAGTTATGGQYA